VKCPGGTRSARVTTAGVPDNARPPADRFTPTNNDKFASDGRASVGRAFPAGAAARVGAGPADRRRRGRARERAGEATRYRPRSSDVDRQVAAGTRSDLPARRSHSPRPSAATHHHTAHSRTAFTSHRLEFTRTSRPSSRRVRLRNGLLYINLCSPKTVAVQ